jgi:hypothetical protein
MIGRVSHTGAPFRRMYPPRLLAVNAFVVSGYS